MRRRGLFFFKLHVCYVFELSCFSRASSSFFFSERGLQAALPLHHFLFKVNNTLFLLFSSPFLKTKSVTHNTSICFSFFFFIYCALSSVCASFLMCVFSFRFSVYFFFFFQPSKKKTFLLQREKKTRREGAPVEVARCSSSFFF